MSSLKVLKSVFLGAIVAMLAGCGGAGGAKTNSSSMVASDSSNNYTANTTTSARQSIDSNYMSLAVLGDPVGGRYQVNRLHATVTICQPGTEKCATIADVLVDSGSTGLRLLASAIPESLNLTTTGNPALVACQQYLDGTFSWGPVVQADIVLGDSRSLKASKVPIQVIADPSLNSLDAYCSRDGESMQSLQTLGANGILGIGINSEDCGNRCVRVTNNSYYFSCSGNVCAGRTASLEQQIKNPIAALPADNNGYAIVLPPVNGTSAVSLNEGYLIFGIGTRNNNQWATLTPLTTNANNGYIKAASSFGTKVNSFLDTGSNGLFFDDPSVSLCTPDNGFYCPAKTLSYATTLTGANGLSKSISFAIDNASDLFVTGNHVLPSLGGPINSPSIFDFGLPFFYGRTVVVGIEGRTAKVGGTSAMGPFYAF